MVYSLPLWGSVPLGIMKLLATHSPPGTSPALSLEASWFHLLDCWGILGLLEKMEGIAGNKIGMVKQTSCTSW